jgi:hypothetical protein
MDFDLLLLIAGLEQLLAEKITMRHGFEYVELGLNTGSPGPPR